MAKAEGRQIDTFPSQMYGVQSDGTVTKMAVDSDGKLKVTPMYFVENGDTLELWWNGCLMQSWTGVQIATPLTGDDGLTGLTGDDGLTELTGEV